MRKSIFYCTISFLTILVSCQKDDHSGPSESYFNESSSKSGGGSGKPSTLNKGLVAYYSFTGNTNDASGQRNHGTIYGAVTLTTDRYGTANTAYSFNGSTESYINVPMSSSLKIQSQISIAAWIYMDGGYYNPRILSNELSGYDQYYMSVAGTSNVTRNLEAAITGSAGGSGFCCGGFYGIDVPALSWHYIVFTVDATGLAKMYLDGSLIKTSQGTLPNNSNYGPNLNIGRNSYPAYDAWGGKLDEIRIYNRALTQKEINWLATH